MRLLLVAAGDAAVQPGPARPTSRSTCRWCCGRAPATTSPTPSPASGTPAAYLLDAEGRVAAPLRQPAPTRCRRWPAWPRGRGVAAVPAAADRAGPVRAGGVGRDVRGGSGATRRRAAGPRRPSPARGRPPSPTGWASTTWASGPTRRPRPTSSAASSPPTTSATTPTSRPTSRSSWAPTAAAARPAAARDLKILLQASASGGPQPVVPAGAGRPGLVPGRRTCPRPTTTRRPPAHAHHLALVVGGEAVLLPPAVRGAVEQLQPRVARFGAQLVDEPSALLDPVRRELVVAAPALTLDWSVLDELPEPAPSRSEPAPVVPGRYPLRAWAMWDSGDPDAPELTPAEALTQALSHPGRRPRPPPGRGRPPRGPAGGHCPRRCSSRHRRARSTDQLAPLTSPDARRAPGRAVSAGSGGWSRA